LVLDAPGQAAEPNAQIQQREANNSSNQVWEFVKAGDAYHIRSKYNQLVLDVAGGSEADGAPVIQYPLNNKPSPNQLWILTERKKG